VPSHTWKVVTVMDVPGQGPSSVSMGTRTIGVIVVNDDAPIARTDDWRLFRVTVREIEQRTGLDFNSLVPRATQDVIETTIDTDPFLCNGF
jgi:endonuclease G, mitochondrial